MGLKQAKDLLIKNKKILTYVFIFGLIVSNIVLGIYYYTNIKTKNERIRVQDEKITEQDEEMDTVEEKFQQSAASLNEKIKRCQRESETRNKSVFELRDMAQWYSHFVGYNLTYQEIADNWDCNPDLKTAERRWIDPSYQNRCKTCNNGYNVLKEGSRSIYKPELSDTISCGGATATPQRSSANRPNRRGTAEEEAAVLGSVCSQM